MIISFDHSDKHIVFTQPDANKVFRLALEKWQKYLKNIEEVNEQFQCLKNNKECNLKKHLGGLVFLTIGRPFLCVQYRQWRWDDHALITKPTYDGISLRIKEYENLLFSMEKINRLTENHSGNKCNHTQWVDAILCESCTPIESLITGSKHDTSLLDLSDTDGA